MPFVTYVYPNQDIASSPTLHKMPGDTQVSRYEAVDEGVTSPDDADYIYISGVKSIFQNATTKSIEFYTNHPYVLPSSTRFNIRASISGVPTSSGFIHLYNVAFFGYKQNELPTYRFYHQYTNSHNPETIYRVPVNSGIVNISIPLSGEVSSSLDGNEIRQLSIIYSGGLHTPSPDADNFRFEVYAMDVEISGHIGSPQSGIPLFISGPRPVTECLQVIDASGYPNRVSCPINVWHEDDTVTLVENSTSWWQRVKDGCHNPTDASYIYADPNESPTNSYSVNSPKFFFPPLTMNNIEGGSQVCFRLRNESLIFDNENEYVEFEDVTWKNAAGTTLAVFDNIKIRPPFDSTFRNYGTPPETVNINDVGDRSYIEFSFAKTATINDAYLQGFHVSEIEICSTGLDPSENSNIPLYTFGVGVVSSGLDLFLYGHNTDSSGLDLFIAGPIPQNSGVPLYTYGINVGSSGIPLYLHSEPDIQCLTPISSALISGNDFFPHWSTELSLTTSNTDFVKSVNSGVHQPVDNSYMWVSGVNYGIFHTMDSPYFYFNRPAIWYPNFLGARLCFRVKTDTTQADASISNIVIRNESLDLVAVWSGVDFALTNAYQDICTSIATDTVHGAETEVFNYYKWAKNEKGRLSFSVLAGSFSLSDSSGVKISEIELCLSGIGGADYIPLYTIGHASDNSGIPLYTVGHATAQSGIPLFTAGPYPVSSYMPLFLKADPIPSSYGSIPLSIFATNGSGIQNTISLYTGGDNNPSTTMPLFLKTDEYGTSTAGMPLFLKMGNLNGSLSDENYIPLYLHNSAIEVGSGIPLFIQVQSGTMGAIPINASMPLYIAREFESTANNVPLYIKVNDSGWNAIPLYISGSVTESNSIPLVMPNVYSAEPSSYIKLYTHGI